MKEVRSRALISFGAVLAYAFLLAPLVVVVGASFDGEALAYFRFPPRQLSFRWYLEIPGRYWSSLALSFSVAFATGAAAVLIGTLAAIGIARGSARGSVALRTYF